MLRKQLHEATTVRSFVEDRDLQRQIRKASVSAMANIAEGFDGGTDLEFRRFLRIAKRSVTEVQSHLYVALDCQYFPQKEFDRLYEACVKVKALIGGFIRYLEGRSKS